MSVFALVDCENFYASCERIFRPDLKYKPIVVLSSNDGCVIARSKEAKQLGIQMGVPWFKTKKNFLKHGGVFFSSNFALYGDISNRVMNILAGMANNIEIYSVDEAFLDLENMNLENSDIADEFAMHCRSLIKQWVGIPVRIGIAPTKTLTKVASYLAKEQTKRPGIFSISNNWMEIASSLKKVPLHEVWGVGRRLSKKLSGLGLRTAYDLACIDISLIRSRYSVVLERTVRELRGEACLQLDKSLDPKKQIVVSRSFSEKITRIEDLFPIVNDFGVRACEKLRKENQLCSKAGVFIRTSPFRIKDKQHSASKFFTLSSPTNDTRDILNGIRKSLPIIFRRNYPYAKSGVMLMNFSDTHVKQYSLFNADNLLKQNGRLMKTIDQINQKENLIRFASQSEVGYTAFRKTNVSPRYTTNWNELPRVNE